MPIPTAVTPLLKTGGNLFQPSASGVPLINPNQTSSTDAFTPVGNAAVQQVQPTPGVNPVQVPGATPTTTTTTTNAQSATALQILQTMSGLQNPLNDFYQVQPLFRFFMTQDIDPFTAASSMKATNANTSPASSGAQSTTVQTAQVYAALDGMEQVILAQSGVTSYNIRSVEIESMVGPNSYTRMIDNTSFTITISESMGVGFQEALLAGAQQLGIKNHLKAFFYLELKFIGYDTSGNIVINPVQGLSIENRWIWQVALIDIDVHMNAGGGTYTLTCKPFTETAYNDDVFIIPETLKVGGGTLGDLTNNLATALNQSWYDRYANDVTKYKFVWHRLSETLQGNFVSPDDPSTYGTNFTAVDYNTVTGLDIETGTNPTFHFQQGVSIDEFIEAVIMNTPAAQKLAKDDAATGSTPLSEPGFRRSIVWRIEPDIQLTAYESFTQQYYKVITYHIRPFYTQLPIIDNGQYLASQKSGVSYTAMQDIVSQGLLKKRYDYLYTGLNIDVIDFQIQYNFAWNAIISRFAGKLNNAVQLQPTAKIASAGNVNASPAVSQAAEQLALSNQEQIGALQSAYNSANQNAASAQTTVSSLQTQIQQSGGTATADQIAQLTQANKDLTAANANKASTQTAYNTALQGAKVPLAQVTQSGTSIYAETLITSAAAQPISPTVTSPMQVSTRQAVKDIDDNSHTGTAPGIDIDKSIFSAIMGQLYAPAANNFMSINITIRGDPYWLGHTNLIRMQNMRGNTPLPANIPNYLVGDTNFLMHFRMPIGYGTDFAPAFKDSLVFNGIYKVHSVKSIFGGSEGFKQELQGFRMPLINTADAATNNGTASTPVTDQNNNPAPVGPVSSPISGNGGIGAASLSSGTKPPTSYVAPAGTTPGSLLDPTDPTP